jgi:prolyl-tRNA synthetase
MVGGLIMAHGDDAGVRLPPALAPTQVVVLLVRDEAGAGEAVASLAKALTGAGVRTHVDDRVDVGFGRRSIEWELKGVPVRVEVGPRDLAEGRVTLVRRIEGIKEAHPVAEAPDRVVAALDEAQRSLLFKARQRREDATVEVESLDAAVEAAQEGWARLPWAVVGDDGEQRLAQRGVTVRCLQRPDGGLPAADDEPGLVAVVGRSY